MNAIAKCWIVGDVEWKDNTAQVRIARTKTAARQMAERMLARYESIWQQHKGDGGLDRDFKSWCTGKDAPFPDTTRGDFVLWAEKQTDTWAHPYKMRRRMLQGVTLHGPKGQSAHITEPSLAASKRLAKRDAH